MFNWFDIGNGLLNYSPGRKKWSIREILEHVCLTNHYLLKLIRKGAAKAIEKAKKEDFTMLLDGYDLDWVKLEPIGIHRSFEWIRPEHMQPGGRMPVHEIRTILELQLQECLLLLNRLQNGEGVLYKTMMSVNNLGKIDVYHYIYFLVQHAKRHLSQIEKMEVEFNLGVA